MGLDIRPKNAKTLFDFTFKNILSVELEDWPDEEIKKATNWDAAIREFNKHINFIFAITFGSPYPVNSFSVGAAEINGNKIHVRLFLFPMNKPKYQYQSIGQIICEFTPNSSSSDLKIWPDFLESNEINEETGKIVLIQMTLRWIDKLMKDHPKSIYLLKNENEINNLKLPNNPEESSQMFYLDDVAEIVNFIKDKIAAGNKIAILFTDENRGAFIVGNDLFDN